MSSKIFKTDFSNVEELNNEFRGYNPDEIRKAAYILRAMNHKLRRKILCFIDNNEKKNVTEIHKAMNIKQSVASQHLAILRRVKIVTATRIGKEIIYSINQERVLQYATSVKEMLG